MVFTDRNRDEIAGLANDGQMVLIIGMRPTAGNRFDFLATTRQLDVIVTQFDIRLITVWTCVKIHGIFLSFLHDTNQNNPKNMIMIIMRT